MSARISWFFCPYSVKPEKGARRKRGKFLPSARTRTCGFQMNVRAIDGRPLRRSAALYLIETA
jgi:hypothetical protein